jgi:hypothetical protein
MVLSNVLINGGRSDLVDYARKFGLVGCEIHFNI